MPPAEILEPANIEVARMGTISLNLDGGFGSARHIGEVQIAEAVLKVAYFPFRIQMVKIPDCRKPDRAEKFDGSVRKGDVCETAFVRGC